MARAIHGRVILLAVFCFVESAMARVQSIYSAAGAPTQFHHEWGADGHKFSPDVMWPFIENSLAK